MADAAEAVARLRLDASGFDKQANASFREFSKQLTSVKDATDAAMRGAEALQKVFVRSLGGTIAIGAASALGDAMRDVGAKIGSAAQAAMDASVGMKGMAQSFEEGAARAEKLNAAADGIVKSLNELKNASPVNAAIFRVFGGEKVLSDLEQATRFEAEAQMTTGAVNAARRARATAGMSPEQIRDYDLQAARKAQLDAARRIQDEGMRNRTVRALQDRFATEDVEAQDRFFRETDPDRRVAKAGFDGDLYDLQRDRQRERMRSDFQAGLREAKRQAEEMAAARRAEEMNLNTMQIVQAQSALNEAEQKKREIDRRVTETDAAAARIAQGVFGSARGPGQRMTSVEIGINRAVERAFNQQTIKSSREYRSSIAGELRAAGQSADAYAVNREIQKRREDQARQQADAPFAAAREAKDQQAKILEYMQQVREVLNELKAYAHVT